MRGGPVSNRFLMFAVLLLTGCTNLPVAGPAHRDISRAATSSLIADRGQVAFDYVLVDLNESVIANVPPDIGPGSFFRSFGERSSSAPAIVVGVGDVLEITVFESSSGGLFIPPEAGVRPGNFVTLPPQTVGKSGTITVPYGGEIRVSGKTTEQIKEEIEEKLSSRAVEPQVVVSLGEQTAMSVSVLGDAASTKFQIRPNERILDVIARAGGMRSPGYESFVTLQRKGKNATVYFPALVRDPRENIFVMGGDTIYIYREQQNFVAVGALGVGSQTEGLTGLFPFEQERLSLNEALAKAGGLLDSRANASNVFLYRMEFREALDHIGIDTSKFPPGVKFIPTIYRANYRDPTVFFLTQQFQMRHRDAIYVANADSVELEKFLFHTRAITSTVAGVAEDALITRDSIRALGD
jgi:polysaccharide export outer membrane protein